MTPDEYQQAIGELARRTTMPDDAAAKIEARREQAFESSAARSEVPDRRRVSFSALAAAAGLVITVGAGVWYAVRQPVTSNNVTRTSATGEAGLKASATADGEVEAATNSGGAHLRVSRHSARKLPPVIRPQGFVAVPAAAGLPQFESGVIVRMSLPVTALPSYGVDISPASTDQPVEADVLVGQDGRARAIRLVNTSRSQQ